MGVTDDERRRRVLDALRPEAVLSHFGVKTRRSGDEFRQRLCPKCGDRSTESVCVDALTGRWYCHPHNCRGDILALVAGFAGLDCQRQFPDVLERAERIAGIDSFKPSATPQRSGASTPPGPRLAVVTPSEESPPTVLDEPIEYPLDEATRRATAVWNRLHDVSEVGAAYLKGRGLEALVGTPTVRYAPLTTEPMTPWGRRVARLLSRPAICVPVHAVDDGSVINVVSRRLEVSCGDDPKVVSLPSMKKVLHGRLLGTFGAWSQFREHPRDVVVVEGVFDYLTGSHLWPDKLVIGADGASLLPKIGELVGEAVARSSHRVFLVPHDDVSGFKGSKGLCLALLTAGVPRARIGVVDLHRHKDLNDAFVAREVPDVA